MATTNISNQQFSLKKAKVHSSLTVHDSICVLPQRHAPNFSDSLRFSLRFQTPTNSVVNNLLKKESTSCMHTKRYAAMYKLSVKTTLRISLAKKRKIPGHGPPVQHLCTNSLRLSAKGKACTQRTFQRAIFQPIIQKHRLDISRSKHEFHQNNIALNLKTLTLQ